MENDADGESLSKQKMLLHLGGCGPGYWLAQRVSNASCQPRQEKHENLC